MRRKVWHAACPCGAVRFRVRTDARQSMPCICRRCREAGQPLRLVAVPADDFAILTGADMLTERLKDASSPHHFFCRTCGEACFGLAGDTVTVNAACLGRGDVAALAPEAAIRQAPVRD